MKARYWKKETKLFYLIVSLTFLFLINTSALAKPVSVETAKLVAENWLSQITGIEQQSLDAISDDGGADLLSGGASPAYYIISMEEGGWAIVSGDDIAQPIIGYAAQGAISPEDLPPAFSEWMANVKEQIETAAQDDTLEQADSETAAEIQNAWEDLDISDYGIGDDALGAVSPLVKTTWAQGKYYNDKCPDDSAGPDGHALVGCCATAIGQVMKYHNWPATGTGSHSYTHSTYGTLSANFGSTSYNWGSMPSSGRVTSYNNAVATLLYHVGVSIDMNYGPSFSGCSGSKIATGLGTYFNYKPVTFVYRSSYSDSVWQGKMRTDLVAGRPIVYAGHGSGGHAFVCDGYTGTNYFHFNWGWNSSYDGNFYINDLTPGPSHNFNSSQGAIFGIEPKGGGLPGKATLVSPAGNTMDTTPTYTWNKVSNATWYQLWVNDSTGHKINKWYTSTSVCSGSTCSVTPSTVLADGSAAWWIQTYNSAGYGPWSNAMSFSVGAPAPSKATLISPSGITADTTPTYRWEAADNATWYYLWVTDSTGNKIKQWYTAASVCSGSTCSVTPATVLAKGSATWWILTWNSVGMGPWSDGMNFHISDPAAASLISPTGTISDSTPTYRWNVASGATWYHLWVNDSTGNKINKWYTASSVCFGSTCSVTPTTKLANGNGAWWIQTYFPSGYGPWSPGLTFKVTAAPGGFNSQFNGEANLWYRLSVTPPWDYNDYFIYTAGAEDKCASIYYGSYSDSNTMYADFDYSVKLWRNGCDSCANAVVVRGNPSPLTAAYNWNNGYYFQYHTGGNYSIFLIKNGVFTTLKGWTYTTAIKKGSAWNVLRVYARGTTLYFYINGRYVASVINSSLSTGKAGFSMYSNGHVHDKIWADYAVLKPVTATTLNIAEEAMVSDGVIIDEALIDTQNGEYSDDIRGTGDYSSDLLLETTAPGSVPEVQVDVQAQGPDS